MRPYVSRTIGPASTHSTTIGADLIGARPKKTFQQLFDHLSTENYRARGPCFPLRSNMDIGLNTAQTSNRYRKMKIDPLDTGQPFAITRCESSTDYSWRNKKMRLFDGEHGRMTHCRNEHPVFIQFVEFFQLFSKWKELLGVPQVDVYTLMNRLTTLQFNMRHHTIEGLNEQYCMRDETGADLWVNFYLMAGSGERVAERVRPHLLDELWRFPQEIPLWLPVAEDADAMLVRDALRANMVVYALRYNFADEYAQRTRLGLKRLDSDRKEDQRDAKRRGMGDAHVEEQQRPKPINLELRQLHIESRMRRDQLDILRRMDALQIESKAQSDSKRRNDPGFVVDRKRRR